MDALLEPVLAWWARLGLPLTASQALALALALFVLLFLSLVAVGWTRRRAHVGETGSVPLARVVRGPKVMGYAAILIFFGGFGAWAAIAPLAGAAIAPGVVSPDGSRKTVEHLEGGIVRAIHVREGDRVRAGQVLGTLEAVSARPEF